MFTLFSHNKIKYNSGQIFPFLIAIICMVLIMAMITVNLGQIALFRTDVSNAADAGALAGASIISGQFLSYGLTSDFMCSNSLVKTAAIVKAMGSIDFPGNILTAISLFMTSISSNMTSFLKAYLDSTMAWTNARKTAMQYAFNNVGVDEPRPTYEDFLDCKLAPCSDTRKAVPTTANYDEYLKGETQAARDFATNGFAKFMEDDKNGWWIVSVFGSGEMPSAAAPMTIVTNGYGWGGRRDGCVPLPLKPSNSFEEVSGNYATCNNNSCWQCYNNFVEVKVESRMMDRFELVKLPGVTTLGWAVFGFIGVLRFLYWFGRLSWATPLNIIFAVIFGAIEGALAKMLVEAMDFGLNFPSIDTDEDADTIPTLDEYINSSKVKVIVKRYKSESNVGLWNFRYASSIPDPIKAQASAHPFREITSGKDETTIEPTFLEGRLWWLITILISVHWIGAAAGIAYLIARHDEYFNTQRHLFEVKIDGIDDFR